MLYKTFFKGKWLIALYNKVNNLYNNIDKKKKKNKTKKEEENKIN